MNKFKSARILVALLVLVLTSLACGGTTEKLQEAAEQPTATAQAVEPTSVPTSEEGEPTPPPKPTATSVPQSEPVQVVAQGFGQNDQDLGVAFLVENPNESFAIEESEFQITAYDEAGTVVETLSGYIELILPNQTLGVADTMWLDEGVAVSEIEVQLLEGDTIATDPIPTFAVESSAYYVSEYTTDVTGVISSPYNRDLTDVRVSAILYNEAGEIVGGGFTYLNFILANGSTGIEVPVAGAESVTTVELYPAISGLTFLGEEEDLPEGANDIVLVKQGWGQDDQEAGFGVLVENPNDDFAVENSQYHVTAFAEDGHVLATEEGYVDVLLPNQTLGIAGSLLLNESMKIARAEIQIKEGSFVESDTIPYFTAENITYQADEYFPQVTGQIVSPYTKDITDVRVSAIAYDEAGEIIGGGFTFLDFVPADGKAAVEVSITSGGTPATTELYATVSGLSEFK